MSERLIFSRTLRGIEPVYRSFTPTFTNFTVGNGTADFEYATIGKMVHYLGTFTLGSTSSVTGQIFVSTPTTQDSSSAGVIIQSATLTDTGLTDFAGGCYLQGGTTFLLGAIIVNATYSSWAGSSATIPFTWGTGDTFKFNIVYKTA